MQEIEAKRRQDELDEMQRRLKSQTSAQSSNLWKWIVGGVSGFVLFSLGIIGISWLSNNNNLTVGNSVNNTVNTSTTSSSSQTVKNSIGMEFVKIPSGSFMMGSDKNDNEKPIHKVTISQEFWMQKTEVTQSQWQAVMENNPSNFKGNNLPVENVSWDDAQEFIKKLNAKGEGTYRLPTEAEWEYAARAGATCARITVLEQQIAILENKPAEDRNYEDAKQFVKLKKELDDCTTGDYAGNLDAMAWYKTNSDKKTQAVATKQANAWGLYNMHGNVWEWCQDWYGSDYYANSASVNPTGATSGSDRVLSGGSWHDAAVYLRSAYRSDDTPSFRGDNVGFRVVRY